MTLNIQNHSKIDLNNARFVLQVNPSNEFTLAVLNKTAWNARIVEKLPGDILNLGKIIDTINQNHLTIPKELYDRLTIASKKHNQRFGVKYLSWLPLFIMNLVKKLGWNCLVSYPLPSTLLSKSRDEQAKAGRQPLVEPKKTRETGQTDESSLVIDENAEEIDLIGKNLTALPASLYKCKNLKILKLENNQISSLPDDFAKHFPHLTELDLSHNPFKSIPDVVFDLLLLKKLSFHGTTDAEPIGTILKIDIATAKKFANLPNLERLELAWCGLNATKTRMILKKFIPNKHCQIITS